MNKQFSVYLDLMRFCAAFMVFVSHVPGFSGGWGWQLAGFGHEAVVFFFVLSGFVISYVVYERKESALKYAVSRLSRIYSVAIPALLLTVSRYYIGLEVNESAFTALNAKLGDPIWTLFSAIFFLNQSWIASPIFSNLPYWSLGYEVLYYVFFGFIIYTKGLTRLVLILLTIIVMGPSILLYLPIWLAGVFCFKGLHKYQLSIFMALLLYVVSVLSVIFLSFDSTQLIINDVVHQTIGNYFYEMLLEPADKFGSDYVLTIFVTLHIYSSYHLIKNLTVFNEKVSGVIRALSAHTFSLYLYHMPILFFISAIAPYNDNPLLNLILAWIITPLFIFGLSSYTENKKSSYKKLFEFIIVKSSLKKQ